MTLQLTYKEDMLKKLKAHDHAKDPEAGSFDQQPGGSSSGNVPPDGESSGKEFVNFHDSTEVQPVNILKAKIVLFIDEDGVVMSMVNVDEIEEGEFVYQCLIKEQIVILHNLNKEDVEELERQEDFEVEDTKELRFDRSVPFGNMNYDDADMEHVTYEEYPDLYT